MERDIVLTNGAGVHAIPIAEFVLTFMLYHAKQLRKLQAKQAEHQWDRGLELQELMDATVLIIGAGSIGTAIAQRAKAFGMRVWGCRRNPQPLEGVLGTYSKLASRQPTTLVANKYLQYTAGQL